MRNKKQKKEDLIKSLRDSLTVEQWSLIDQLQGRAVKEGKKPSPTSRSNILNSLFVKTRCISTRKGISRNLQKWLENKIGDLLNESHGKDTEICAREMGQSGPDVALSPRIRKLFCFTIECKSGETWDLRGAIRQCRKNLYPDTNWMICLDRPHIKPNERFLPIICLDGQVFFELLKK